MISYSALLLKYYCGKKEFYFAFLWVLAWDDGYGSGGGFDKEIFLCVGFMLTILLLLLFLRWRLLL